MIPALPPRKAIRVRWWWYALVLAATAATLVIILSACGGDDDDVSDLAPGRDDWFTTISPTGTKVECLVVNDTVGEDDFEMFCLVVEQ